MLGLKEEHVEKDYPQTFGYYAKAVGVDVGKHGDLEHKLTAKQENES